ncbi:hypothetical protein K470DRAFT_225447 [Piedraia hortae CBS 480.64]|uniref:MICOS complex subunit n=1 Tax=Piedraia hortae CBS 480.64 TaxID=1314780 RepID=A0A6A7C9Z2_9PEZI|nr:hypothetical protein K470DRAFT_225447 [Piedraia hortae CBS 480.64]
MAFQALRPMAPLMAGFAMLPRVTQAEEPYSDPLRRLRERKPIYGPKEEPTVSQITATTPPPASGVTETPQTEEQKLKSKPTPTDRLAAEIRRGRLMLHGAAVKAEDGVNNAMDRFMSAEQSFTSTIVSLAPPKESNERLMPGGIYVLVATMAGSILARNRNILFRFVTPIITGVTAAHYVVPRTTQNVENLIWRWEERYPVIRDNHLRASNGIRHFIETGKAHSQMGLAMAEEKAGDIKGAIEGWAKRK